LKNALVDQLPSPEREVFLLRHYRGLSVEETAKLLRLTPDVVKKGSQKAKQMALRIAKEQGIEI